ncbi:MAG: hypothetical protein M1831_000031 [Alyxoria varia]|nr:MAG: hypothetical protein M1831_000031 [Alyxoria varia]
MTSTRSSKPRRTSQTSSIASSIRSTNSDQSYDSSAIPEAEPLIQERGPPPAYSPPEVPVARSAYVPAQSVAEPSEGRTYGTINAPSRSYDADLYEASEDADEEDNDGDEHDTSEEIIAWPKCEDVQISRNESFEFKQSTNFTLLEHVQSEPFSDGTIIGKVFLTTGDSNQEAAIKVDTFMASSSLTFLEHVSFAHGKDDLTIDSTNAPYRDKKCTVINLVISIGESSIFDNIALQTKHLSLDAGSKLALETERLFLKSDSGDVTLSESHESHVEARHVEVETTLSAIKGRYPLNGLLSISTHSGPVDVCVEPQDGQFEKHGMSPTTLKITSSTGKVTVRDCERKKHTMNVPARNYRTQITTFSGSINAYLLHGSSTGLETTSGSLAAEITPVISRPDMNSTLYTGATFSHTDLTMKSPRSSSNGLGDDAETATKQDTTLMSSSHDMNSVLRNMKSKHETVSGSMRLRYPSEWEGSITGESISGGVDVAGKGVEIESRARGGKEIHAVKGTSEDVRSILRFASVTGSGEVLVGEPGLMITAQ